MKTSLFTPIPVFVLALLQSSLALISAQPGHWKSLFDGRTLDGWEFEENAWRVEEGAIVGEIPPGTTLNHNTWLIWRGGELVDFELRLQFQLHGAPAANSGIQFRCQADHVKHVSGYQADLDMGATWLGPMPLGKANNLQQELALTRVVFC